MNKQNLNTYKVSDNKSIKQYSPLISNSLQPLNVHNDHKDSSEPVKYSLTNLPYCESSDTTSTSVLYIQPRSTLTQSGNKINKKFNNNINMNSPKAMADSYAMPNYSYLNSMAPANSQYSSTTKGTTSSYRSGGRQQYSYGNSHTVRNSSNRTNSAMACKKSVIKCLNESLPLSVAWVLLLGTAIAYAYGPGQWLWFNNSTIPDSFQALMKPTSFMNIEPKAPDRIVYHWKPGGGTFNNVKKSIASLEADDFLSLPHVELNNMDHQNDAKEDSYVDNDRNLNNNYKRDVRNNFKNNAWWIDQVFRPLRIILYLHIVLFTYLLVNFMASILVDPGILPRAGIEEEIYRMGGSGNDPNDDFKAPLYTQIEIKGVTVQLKWCNTCKFYRPPRCSHCSVCDACIERFDHHCPWLHNCVGKGNYKFFFIFLVLLTVHTLTVLVFSLSYAFLNFRTLMNPPGIITISLCTLAFVLLLPVTGLCGFHTILVVKGRTTNEHVTGKFKRVDNPYDVGWFHNCIHILATSDSFIKMRCFPYSSYLKRWDNNFIRCQQKKFSRLPPGALSNYMKLRKTNTKGSFFTTNPKDKKRYYVRYTKNPDKRQNLIMDKVRGYIYRPDLSYDQYSLELVPPPPPPVAPLTNSSEFQAPNGRGVLLTSRPKPTNNSILVQQNSQNVARNHQAPHHVQMQHTQPFLSQKGPRPYQHLENIDEQTAVHGSPNIVLCNVPRGNKADDAPRKSIGGNSIFRRHPSNVSLLEGKPRDSITPIDGEIIMPVTDSNLPQFPQSSKSSIYNNRDALASASLLQDTNLDLDLKTIQV